MAAHWEIIRDGRIIVSNTPEDLFNAACTYFEWCDKHPIEEYKTLTSGKEAGKVVKQVFTRPYSIAGLCLHCGITEDYIRDIKDSKDKNSLYYLAVERILKIVYVQNLEFAIVGVFNPIFTSKVLNLGNEEVPTGSIKVEIVGDLPALARHESEIMEKLVDKNTTSENSESEKS